jgi:predicted transposase YdaD
MAGLPDSHDRFFRQVFSHREAAMDLVRHYLPEEVASCLLVDSLEIAPDSFVDADLRRHLSDLVCRVQLQEGGEAFVYLLVEHKSEPDPKVALQILRYMTRLWSHHLRQRRGLPLPPVIPLVLYHGSSRWSVPTDFSALFRCPDELLPLLPRFRYLLTDLTTYRDDEIHGAGLARMAFLAMLHVFRSDVLAALPLIVKELESVPDAGMLREAMEALLAYLSSVDDRVTEDHVEEAVLEALPGPEGERIVATFAERWMEEGKRKGLEEGVRAHAREAVLEVLGVRFGPVPGSLRERIAETADLELLRTWLKKAIVAESLQEFQGMVGA